MSKISFTIALPHDGPGGNRTPQFFISTSNMTYLSFKGADFKGARFGNSNATSGWKNRFEYSVVAAKGITKFSIQMNTSVILPNLSWGLPSPPPKKGKEAEKEKGKEKEKEKEKPRSKSNGSSRGSSSNSRSSTSRSSRSSRQSKRHDELIYRPTTKDDSRESSRQSERRHEQPRLRNPTPPRRLRDIEDQAYRRHGQRKRRGSQRDYSPGVVDPFDGPR